MDQMQIPRNVWQKEATPMVFDPARHDRVSNQAITVAIDRATGQFWIETNKGVPLLFSQHNGVTSFSNFRFEGVTYTNNDLHGPQSPQFTTRMPFGATSVRPDRLEFRTTLVSREKRLECTQQFIPSLDSNYAFIRIRTVFRNTSNVPVRAGLQLLYDLYLDRTDLVDVVVDGAQVTRESGWYDAAIPDLWEASTASSPIRIRARFAHAELIKPDGFVVGSWQYNGYLGAAAWNYAPSGLRFWDNAALMQWNERDLRPGDSLVVSTDYGYLTLYEAVMRCSADTVSLSADETRYVPNPFEVRAEIVNTGLVTIPSLTVALNVPSGATLASGETPTKSTVAPLLPGDKVVLPWRVQAALVDAGSVLDFSFDLTDPLLLRQQCATQVGLPAIPRYTAAIACPDTFKTTLSTDGKDYSPNPFTVSTEIINTGTAPLTNLQAIISLPPELTLAAGPASVTVTPNPLPPGQKGIATWLLRAAPQKSELTVGYLVALLFRGQPLSSCVGHVLLREIVGEDPCVETNVTTRGTEFWTFFLPNEYSSSGQKNLVLYFVAGEDSHVHVEVPMLSRNADLFVQAGTMRQYTVDNILDVHPEERVSGRGVHITSDKPVAVYQASLVERHSDASMVLPLHALGLSYATAGYNFSSSDAEEHFGIVATENGTLVTIDAFGMTSMQSAPRTPWTVPMNQGETYYVRSGIMGRFGGLTGSLITSNKPIAVMSGGQTGWIPSNNRTFYGYLNPHYDQIIPDTLLGTEYIAVPFRARRGGDTFKAVAIMDSTIVYVGTVPVLTLSQRGDWDEFMLDSPSRVWSNHPFLLAQFANSAAWDTPDNSGEYGDASMVVLSPTNLMSQCHSFPLHPSTDTARFPRFTDAFVNLVVPDGGEGQVTLNGAAVPDTTFHQVPFSTYRCAQIAITDTLGNVGTSDVRGIGAIVYGFEFHDAFSVNSGFVVKKTHKFTSAEDPPRVEGFALDPITPNPVTNATTLRYSLPSRCEIDLAVYSGVGSRILELEHGSRDGGAHAFHVRAAQLPAGFYHVVLTHPGGRVVRPMVIVR
jgi:hypothetical protein